MQKHALALDTFRVIAILMVFACHLNFFDLAMVGDRTILHPNYYNIGGLAAHFFIVLSAFFAAYSYEKSIAQGYKAYVTKRMRRLYPTNWALLPFYVVLCLILGFYGRPISQMIVDILLSGLLLQELFNFSAKVFNTPAWTISTLFILYLITPVLMQPLKRIRGAHWWVVLIIVLTVGDIYYRQWLTHMKPDNWWLNYASPVCRITAYLEGLALGYAARQLTAPGWVRNYATLWETLVTGIAVCCLFYLPVNNYVCDNIFFLCCPVVIALFFQKDGGRLSSFFGKEIFSGWSRYVYSFYLAQFLFLLTDYLIFGKVLGLWGHLSHAAALGIIAMNFALCVITSMLLYHKLERRI